ncbi:MAG: formate dehydrogenase subunit gamma [Proteobacteria bacterium]|nr:formate dehydrogenase subunit gamma [Pseudomonadota bacterium]
MLTRTRFGFLILLVWAMLVPSFAAAQAPAADSSVKQQSDRQTSQPGNNAPVWRDVRSGESNSTTAAGREAGVLVLSSGDTWRRIRQGPITVYGGWLVVISALIIAAIYFAKGPIKLHGKPTGRTITRFSTVERWAHWVMGISFVVLGVSGLVMLFGKHVLLPVIGYTLFAWLTVLLKNLHNFIAPLFVLSLLVFIVIYAKDNLPKAYDFAWFGKVFGFFFRGEHIPSGRFNGGEKAWFWGGVVVLCLIVSASGLVLLFPNLEQLRETMQQAHIVHAVASVLVMAASLGHIYMGTIGVEGAYQAMRTGFVDEIWAKEHHQYWHDEVRGKAAPAASAGAVPAGAARKPRVE